MKKSITSKIIAFAAAAAMIMSMGAAVFGASYIGENTAISKALKNAGTIRSAVWDLECEKDKDDGVTVYEVEFKKGRTEYSYKINAKTGAVREKSVEYGYRYSSGKLIGQTAAIDKAFAFSGISKASVTNLVCRYDYDDGKAVYEVKFRKGSWKYEYDVNARTGKIVEYSREYSPKKSTVDTNHKYIGKDKALETALAKAGLVKSQITFEKPDYKVFRGLSLAIEAGKTGGTMPTVFNAANERAVAKFLKGEIKYTDIVRSIEKCMDAHKVSAHPDLEEILATEQWVYSILQ